MASPIACIVTLADCCASSGMNSATVDRLPCLLQVHRSCAASGRSCQKIVRISYPTRSRIRRHRCDGFACALQPQKLQAELAARLLSPARLTTKAGSRIQGLQPIGKSVRADFRYRGPILVRICESDEKALKLHLSRADFVPS